MAATVNAAAVKAAATITRRIAGRGEVTVTSAGRTLRFTRATTWQGGPHRNPADHDATATAVVPVDGLETPMHGCGVLADDDLRRIATAKGSITVENAGDGFRFTAGGVQLGVTRAGVPTPEPEPDRFLGSRHAVQVSPDAYHAAEAVRVMQGVAEAAASGTDARLVLATVALDPDGTMAATDTYRLHVAGRRYVSGDPHLPEALLPAYAVRTIPAAKVAMFALAAQPHGHGKGRWAMNLHLRYGTKRQPCTVQVMAEGSTIEGPYPNWRQLMPDGMPDDRWQPVAATYAIPDGMVDAVKAVQPKGPTLVRWQDDGNLHLHAMDETPYSASITLPKDGPSATLGTATTGSAEVIMNATYLRQASGFVGDGSTVELRDPMRAVHFVGTDRAALVMPMRAGGR